MGGAIFSPAVAQHMLRFIAAPPAGPTARGRIFPEFTGREREVLRLIAQGYTNTAIAEQLVLSPTTVRNYVSEIFSKLQPHAQGGEEPGDAHLRLVPMAGKLGNSDC